MNKIVKDATVMAAIGAAGYCAYKCMSVSDRQKLTRDAKRTAHDMGHVTQDMARMAGTIKETF